MLVKLFVQNYALIRQLDISFGEGLTVITGETGAGKSILLGALSLVLGSRADTGVLLDKSVKCVVESAFRITDYDLAGFFSSNELDYDHTTILRREINPAGKSRAFVNDTPVNLNVLRELGERLIDIHSQHQTLMLNESVFQLNVLDSFAGNGKLLGNYRSQYHHYSFLKKEYGMIRDQAEKNKSDLEYFQFQLNQLEAANLRNDEQEELEHEQEILEHAEEIRSALGGSSELLVAGETSLLGMLRNLRNNIGRIRSYLPDAENLYNRLESVYIELDDISAEIERLAATVEDDPGRLRFISERLDMIYTLIQKHRVKDLSELIARKTELKNKVDSIITTDERLGELEKELEKELDALKILGEEISGKRSAVTGEVEEKISGLLRQLGMPNARFMVELTRKKDYTVSGFDNAEFHFTANKQVPPENIARVASGGELSRVMLSLKSLLTRNNNLPTIIFDEIDAGVSGEVADKVGQILSEMGRYMQVINITHLPQVAARGHGHYHVYKDDTEHSTITRVKLLTEEERIFEVAKLLSGSEVTETAMKNARELLGMGG